MSSGDGAFEELLIGSFQGDETQRVGFTGEGRSPAEGHENFVPMSPTVPLEGDMSCGGCGGRVWDRFILYAVGQAWHSTCLRCSLCQCELQMHPSLFCRDGKIYCQQDYYSLFSVGACARCAQPIPSSTLVMRSGALTFHPHCFTCQECNVILLPGSLYFLHGRNLYCEAHYHGSSMTNLSQHCQLRHKEGDGEEPVSSPEIQPGEGAAGDKTQARAKRIRTCFRSEQLRAMESYFALKHNPNGKDWSSLSYKTGLPKRVLQVWFQNARAKLRRSLSINESQSGSPAPPPASTTTSASMCLTNSQQPLACETSTIDQLELSLLTAPLEEAPQSPYQQSQGFKDSFYFDSSTEVRAGLCPLTSFELEESGIKEETGENYH
ncbi:LIM/homeobox protein Awh-like [Paramormyrops kingsleyae]|uniref:LIM/homeobox protein Lhx9 n=1 Tax=Paramormyrops kingsleyae TaxID=1676925 RepID=A0A3B3SPE4_9TELE|nr:LIM/homeobox protein Awh-like [Paramormyrops kingsleyae]